MVDKNNLVRLVRVIPSRYRFCIVLISICCPLSFSFALQFSGFLQTMLVLTGCIAIWGAIILIFLNPPDNAKPKK